MGISSHRALPAARILRAVASAAERWQNADFPPRVRATAALIARTRYSEPVVDYALDRLFEAGNAADLQAAICGEIGDLAALDGWITRPGRPDLYARGLTHVAVIASRTTIGVALPAAIFALIAKCRVVVKDREDGLIRSFFKTLIEEEPLLHQAAFAESWTGADPDRLSGMDAVVAFGGNEALKNIRESLDIQTRFIAFGPRISCGIVPQRFLFPDDDAISVRRRKDIVDGIARDVMLYEAEGCMSMHVLFLPRTSAFSKDAMEAFARDLSQALAIAAIEFPPARNIPEQQLRISASRASLRFRMQQQNGLMLETPVSCVLVSPDEPPSFLPGTLSVIPVDGPEMVRSYLERHHLHVEAVSSDENDLNSTLYAEATKAVRITGFGRLQHPPFDGEHGGRPRITDFLEFVTRE